MKKVWAFVLFGLVASVFGASGPSAEAQASYQRISGEGSSWSAGAIDAMRVNVKQFGITVDYNPSGSSAGRKNFLNGTWKLCIYSGNGRRHLVYLQLEDQRSACHQSPTFR